MTPQIFSARTKTDSVPGRSMWIIAILLATIFEGALRKWVLPPSYHAAAYAAKDVLALGFVLRLGIPAHLKHLRGMRVYVALIGLLLAYSFVTGAVVSPNGALMVFKNAVLWPLFALQLGVSLDVFSMARVTRMLAVACIGIAILGSLQFNLPTTSPLNTYAWNTLDTPDVSTFGTSDR